MVQIPTEGDLPPHHRLVASGVLVGKPVHLRRRVPAVFGVTLVFRIYHHRLVYRHEVYLCGRVAPPVVVCADAEAALEEEAELLG